MAVYKTKSFSKWAVNAGLHDFELRQAADEVISGLVDANLGGGIYKKRVALPGNRGKRAGGRTLIAFSRGKHLFYLYGFEKSEKSNVSQKELRALKKAAGVWLSFNAADLVKAIKAGFIVEIEKEE